MPDPKEKPAEDDDAPTGMPPGEPEETPLGVPADADPDDEAQPGTEQDPPAAS